MPAPSFKTAESKERHLERCRRCAKRLYDTERGREKKLLAYYKRKFIEDAHAQSICGDRELSLDDKLRMLKIYNLEKKMELI